MIDISKKYSTARTAVASAVVTLKPETLRRIEQNDLPKTDPFIVAKWSGIQAAKKTSGLIPACHQVPLDYIDIEFSISKNPPEITVISTVKAEYKTGVEMEALTAVSIAALTIYDMLKPVDDSVKILETKLIKKTGGINIKTEKHNYKAAVIVISDASSKGEREDKSGPEAKGFLQDLGFNVSEIIIIPDDAEKIKKNIIALCENNVDLIITSGGTGLGNRDFTTSAIEEILDKKMPGINEWARSYGRTKTPFAILSNSVAGIRDKTLIIALPGSPKAVNESLFALKSSLIHAIKMIKGEKH